MMLQEPVTTQSAIGSLIAQAQAGSIAISAAGSVGNVSISALIPPPRPVEGQTLQAAQQQLAALPLDRVPEVSPLPPGSHLPEMSPNAYFVGRSLALRHLAAALKGEQTGGGSIPIVAVTGIGGLGKTQLAIEFLYRYGAYFVGGVFWLNFADASGIATQVEACSIALGMELSSGKRPSLDTVVQWVRSAWQSPLPRLLIFDNCEEEALLEEWRLRTGGCRVLVTSRRARWSAESSLIQLSLAVLGRAESLKLLQKHRPDLGAD